MTDEPCWCRDLQNKADRAVLTGHVFASQQGTSSPPRRLRRGTLLEAESYPEADPFAGHSKAPCSDRGHRDIRIDSADYRCIDRTVEAHVPAQLILKPLRAKAVRVFSREVNASQTRVDPMYATTGSLCVYDASSCDEGAR
jgi:hypothetical protein